MTTRQYYVKVIIRVLGILVTVASIAWAVYTHYRAEYRREMDASTIVRQAMQIYNLERLNRQYEQENAMLEQENDSIRVVADRYYKQSEFYEQQAGAFQQEIARLKAQLDETPVFVIDDDVLFFLEWSGAGFNPHPTPEH